ncbi:DUF2827 family protein [Paraburkholderia terrae]
MPHHMKSSGPLLLSLTVVPVRGMPQIWSPMFIPPQIEAWGCPG